MWNKEAQRKWRKEYYAKNREKFRQKAKEYYWKHKKENNDACKQWYLEHKPEKREYVKKELEKFKQLTNSLRTPCIICGKIMESDYRGVAFHAKNGKTHSTHYRFYLKHRDLI